MTTITLSRPNALAFWGIAREYTTSNCPIEESNSPGTAETTNIQWSAIVIPRMIPFQANLRSKVI